MSTSDTLLVLPLLRLQLHGHCNCRSNLHSLILSTFHLSHRTQAHQPTSRCKRRQPYLNSRLLHSILGSRTLLPSLSSLFWQTQHRKRDTHPALLERNCSIDLSRRHPRHPPECHSIRKQLRAHRRLRQRPQSNPRDPRPIHERRQRACTNKIHEQYLGSCKRSRQRRRQATHDRNIKHGGDRTLRLAHRIIPLLSRW